LIQGVLGEELAFLLIVILYGLQVGLIGAQGKRHFKIEKVYKLDADLDEVPKEGESDRDQTDKMYKKLQKLQWHGKMVLMPVSTMLSSTFVFFFGAGQVLLRRMYLNQTCHGGLFEALTQVSPVEGLLILWDAIVYGVVLLTQTMLAITHHRCYTKLARTANESLKPHEEYSFPVLYGKRVHKAYIFMLVTQVRLLPRAAPSKLRHSHCRTATTVLSTCDSHWVAVGAST
jgi:hypothetical protein